MSCLSRGGKGGGGDSCGFVDEETTLGSGFEFVVARADEDWTSEGVCSDETGFGDSADSGGEPMKADRTRRSAVTCSSSRRCLDNACSIFQF